jgi:hypothetical protein
MAFELRYPAGSGGTASWQPGKDFDLRRSGQDRITFTIAQMVGRRVFSYRLEAHVWQYTRGFADLGFSDVTALETFFAAVDGDPFDFTDGSCGPISSFTKVLLVPESYARPYDHVQASYMGIVFTMIEAE